MKLRAASDPDEKKKEPELEKAQASKAEVLDPWATPRDAAESSYEEDNTDPDEPEIGTVWWIVFEGENEPVRLDQLSAKQEMMLEKGKLYRYYDIQDCYYMKKVAETAKAWETKGMAENDKKESATSAMPAENVVEKSQAQAVNDQKEEANPTSEPVPRRPITLD